MDSGKGPARAGQISAREARDLLKAAREDPTLKALVLRIDTRGGEANASEAIWREVRLMMMMMMMMRSGARCD
jgi:protease-4